MINRLLFRLFLDIYYKVTRSRLFFDIYHRAIRSRVFHQFSLKNILLEFINYTYV